MTLFVHKKGSLILGSRFSIDIVLSTGNYHQIVTVTAYICQLVKILSGKIVNLSLAASILYIEYLCHDELMLCRRPRGLF